MGLVEGVFCKIHHVIINTACHLFADSLGNTAGHALFLISIDKVCALLFHNRLLLLTHGTAHKVTSPKGIPAQIPDNLHNLLLIDNTAIGRLQNRLQLGTGIGNRMMLVLSHNIFRNKIHGAGTIQGNSRDNILQILRLQLLHEILHAGTFQLEHPFCLSCSDGSQYLRVIIINIIDINPLSRAFLNIIYRIMDNRQGSQSQKVHFQKSQLLQRCHGKLGGNGTVASSGKGYKFIRRLLADNHTRRMHGGMSGQSLQPLAHINQVMHLLILLIELPHLRVHLQRPVQCNVQFIGHHFCNGIHKGIGQIHHAPHIPDNTLCRQRTEGNNLYHLVRAVFSAHIINYLLPPVVAEVNINIRHGHTLRI